VTGTAQRRLAPGRDHDGAVLAQAMLLVAGDVDEGTRMASRFYELAGGELRFAPGTSTTIAQAIGWQESEDELVRGLAQRLTGAADPGGNKRRHSLRKMQKPQPAPHQKRP
jgi:hypothetical protein